MTSYKWNITYLGDEIEEKLSDGWDSLPRDALFFFKFKHITRFCRQHLIQKSKEYR